MSKATKDAAVPREQEWPNGAERAQLVSCEETLRRGAEHDIARGKALATIRDLRLYRWSHATFEDYCRQPQWGLSRSRAYELMAAAGITASLSAIADTPLPTSEAVARELAPLREDPEAMAAAMSTAVEQHGALPTAAQVREVVRGPEPEPPGGDIRWSIIENAISRMCDLPPTAANFSLPTERGDLAAMDAAIKRLDGWLPEFKQTWKQHKRDVRGLRAVG